jgi:hypothetical protein
MKNRTMILVLLALVGSAFGQSYQAPVGKQKPVRAMATPPPLSKRAPEGVLPRAARGGNPLQMLNPLAPARYGTSTQSLVIDPETGKWQGIKFFEIFF